MPKPETLLSEEMKAMADALHNIRRRLNTMIAAGQWPAGLDFTAVGVVLTAGLETECALRKLAEDHP